MGIFNTIFKRPRADIAADGYFKMLNGYTPVFTNAPESIYEMELTRAAVHSFATFCSKLKPEISGTAKKTLEKTLQFKVYDVSAVSIPANADTDISARSFFDGVIEKEQAERLERRRKLLKIKIMTEV